MNKIPFTYEQLKLFQAEIQEAGGVDELMIQKEALSRTNGLLMISTYRDIEGYKEKYLNGLYRPLRQYYSTEVPYVFWSRLFEQCK